jgi:hypothetical protein
MSGDYSNSVESEEDDNSFDQLCRNLLAQNSSRYQEQTLELLAKGFLVGELNGYRFEYRIEKRMYLNWRKSRKIKYLPQFFAQCEASLIEN